MTEEIKKCDCKEKSIKKLKEFTFIAGAVFVGGTLAILLSANILKPKCHCPAPCPIHQGIMQPMPPAPMINHGYRSEFGGPGEGFRAPDHKMFKRYGKMHREFRPEGSAPRDFGRPNDITSPAAPKTHK